MITPRRIALALVASLALLAPAGCSFPGAGVSVSFTSHKDHERIYGSRTVSVAGEVVGGTVDAFTLTHDGKTVKGVSLAGGTFSATVDLTDGDNTFVASAVAAGFTYTATLHLTYPFLALKDTQAAAIVMGASNFTSAPTARQTGQDLLYRPAGAPALIGSRLYLPDTGNDRVVGYTSVPTAPAGANFDILLGKPAVDWTNTDTPTVSRTTLSAPAGVAAAGSGLAVVDTGFNRVLLWSGTPTTASTQPETVVGQPGFAQDPAACTREGLSGPRAAIVAGGKLIVADTGNNRVLIWKHLPAAGANAAPADLVLGQKDFTHCQANRSATPTSPTARTLAAPSDVWSDGTRLVVADTDNNRVLVWNAFPTSDGAPASVAVGQKDLLTGAAQLADDATVGAPVGTGLAGPRSAASNGNQLFVADTGHNRVVIFDAVPAADGARADRVLGQADLTGTAANGGGIKATTLSGPEGVRVFDGYAIVADTGNSRELLYQRP